MKYTEDNFLEKEISINKELLLSLPVTEIATWSHLELLCTIRSIEINKDLVMFITSGALYINNLYNIIVDAIKTTDFITEYVNNIEYVELVYGLFSAITKNNKIKQTCEKFWFNENYNHLIDELYITDEHKLYELMHVLDARFPVLLVKFYYRHKRILHTHDQQFVGWLFKQYKIKAQHNESYKMLYNAMEKEFSNEQNIAMFLR